MSYNEKRFWLFIGVMGVVACVERMLWTGAWSDMVKALSKGLGSFSREVMGFVVMGLSGLM
jgi:hypothetical protein